MIYDITNFFNNSINISSVVYSKSPFEPIDAYTKVPVLSYDFLDREYLQ